MWTDVTCEIHEITTDTGRAGATDRFKPGTAEIVASNINRLSRDDLPAAADTDIGFRFEYVPQPPIDHEEDLQAPNAATIISNGWSFSDDFETAPPRWIFPPAWATTGTYPTGPFSGRRLAGRTRGVRPTASVDWSRRTPPPSGPARTRPR